MNDDDLVRLASLRGDGSVTPEYLNDFYGLRWPWGGELRHHFATWLARSPRRRPWDESRPSRFIIEGFLRDQRVEAVKWVACRLGMDEASFGSLLDHLPQLGMPRQRYEVYPGLISTSFGDDLDGHLPSMKFRSFGPQTYCEFLHHDLSIRLGIEVRPLWCATSDELADTVLGYPREYARHFDCITLKPLSVRHQMVMDFGKPLYLPPDLCSKLLYSRSRALLQANHGGSTEPRDIHDYEVPAHA